MTNHANTQTLVATITTITRATTVTNQTRILASLPSLPVGEVDLITKEADQTTKDQLKLDQY